MDGSKPATVNKPGAGPLSLALTRSRIPGLDFLRTLAVPAVLQEQFYLATLSTLAHLSYTHFGMPIRR